ncbi:MAG: EAL domain-containing protein [Clostridiales bacterium]|nr:EAL domain-containing protein [Clostridiales bacterium]
MGLFQDDFLDFYINTKNKYHLPDGMLELEFTESVVLNNNELFQTFVEELQDNGFVCSLDDFGSGYSSLNVLKELQIQVLKLDMLFFRKGANTEREQIVIRNIITMAKQLKMRTVSEGVEMKEQVDFLRKVGCDIVQGYVFAKPMPLAQFKQLLIDKVDGFQL